MSEKKRKLGWYSIVLILIILVFLVLLIIQNTKPATGKVINMLPLTGHATEGSTVSNVTIEKYLSISLCPNMSDGISFGNVTELPAINLNATHNYDGAADASTLCVNVSTDSNTPVDFCTKGDGPLTSADLDEIGLNNETYLNSTTTDATTPGPASSSISLTTSYAKSGDSIDPGSENWYRFWLDIPAAQESGDYNNTIWFKGVTTSLACGA